MPPRQKLGTPPATFQDLVFALKRYWSDEGCVILEPYDMEMGAGTFHPATFLRAVGPEPWSAAYVQPSRRPTDGRYGENPFRLQHYYQFQVVIKPSPEDIVEKYLGSLRALGFDPLTHDIRLVEDNWESPTLGAWGLGWEIWLNGMEITQFTYFQQVGGIDCRPVMGEITYGLERLAMYLQGVDSCWDLQWAPGVTYADVHARDDAGWSLLHAAAMPDSHGSGFESSDGASVAAMRALVRHGVTPDVVGPGGTTALMLVAEDGDVEATAALLALGADPGIRDAGGRRAVDLARGSEYHLAEILATASVDTADAVRRSRERARMCVDLLGTR